MSVKLRDVAGPLEAALTRLRARADARLPVVIVAAHRSDSGIFIQYAGSFSRPCMLVMCFNPDTREIAGFEQAATEFFGHQMHIDEGETVGFWYKECESVTRAVEHGMHVLRHILMLGWDAELFIDEHEQARQFMRAKFLGRPGGER